jgi:hypothetical protein
MTAQPSHILRVAVPSTGLLLALGFAHQYFRFSMGVDPEDSPVAALAVGVGVGVGMCAGLFMAPFASRQGSSFRVITAIALIPGNVMMALAASDAIRVWAASRPLPVLTNVLYTLGSIMFLGAWWLLLARQPSRSVNVP